MSKGNSEDGRYMVEVGVLYVRVINAGHATLLKVNRAKCNCPNINNMLDLPLLDKMSFEGYLRAIFLFLLLKFCGI